MADAVVVAAGSSRRMGGADKLSALVAGRSVLRWSIESLAAAPEIADIIVVAPAHREAELRRLTAAPPGRIVSGGQRRQDSWRQVPTRVPTSCSF
jgi:2-C-methyl-D-erythritol 4-phosphate cytidylyltransferase